MSAATGRTTYERASAGFDPDHQQALAAAILDAIIETSKLTDANCIALRTGEIAAALTTALAGVLTLSPCVTRSPTAIRKLCDDLRRRLIRMVAEAEHDADVQSFKGRVFNGGDVGGRA
jgi:hypothetical protein